MIKLLVNLRVLMLVLSFSAQASGNDQLWEVTTRVDMTGMAMPEVTRTMCLNRSDPYTPSKVPHQKHCQVSDLKLFSGTTTWNIYCRGVEPMSGSGKVVRDENNLSGTMSLSSKSIEMRQVITGKLVGTCNK